MTLYKMKHLQETLIDSLSSIKIYEKLKIRKTKVNNCFCITALEDGKISFWHFNNDSLSLYYSFDLQKWIKWDFSDIEIKKGDNVYFLGDNEDGFAKHKINPNIFYIKSKVNISGNLLSLINGDYVSHTFTYDDMQTDYCFVGLFKSGSGIIDASNLILPDNVTEGCYSGMFDGCISLVKAPELPALDLAKDCYKQMFKCCYSLKTAPELPATNLADSCYESMFFECSALTKAPDLPATILARYCYKGMFYYCHSLTKGPELPATKAAPNCYKEMFKDSGIKDMPAIKSKIKISNNSLYAKNMFKGTAIKI